MSEYKLIPTVSHIRFNIYPNNATVFVDGSEQTAYFNTEVEVPKGVRFIQVKAPHFYSREFNLQTFANQVHKVDINLLPINGALTIDPGINAANAICFIESKELGIQKYKIGSTPISELSLQEGEYTLSFEKKGFATQEKEYKIRIKKSETNRFEVKMFNQKEISITTIPDGASIYIDDIYIGTSNISKKISIGSHDIKIEKHNYNAQTETVLISENDENNIFSYSLVPKLLTVTFHTKPSDVRVMGDGLYFYIPNKELTASLPFGQYKVTYSKTGFFDKNKTINVKNNGDVFKAKLFPSSFGQFGVSSGLDMYYLNLNGCIYKRLCLGFGVGGNLKKHDFPFPINVANASVDDISTYNKVGIIDNNDSKDSAGGAWCFNIKFGLLFQKPFYFIINLGYAGMRSHAYQNVFLAKHGYLSSDGKTIINKDDYFTSPQIFKKGYNSFIIGVSIPLARKFYISADYYTNSEVGKGFVYTAGLIFHI